jgi:hypothetical protein
LIVIINLFLASPLQPIYGFTFPKIRWDIFTCT